MNKNNHILLLLTRYINHIFDFIKKFYNYFLLLILKWKERVFFFYKYITIYVLFFFCIYMLCCLKVLHAPFFFSLNTDIVQKIIPNLAEHYYYYQKYQQLSFFHLIHCIRKVYYKLNTIYVFDYTSTKYNFFFFNFYLHELVALPSIKRNIILFLHYNKYLMPFVFILICFFDHMFAKIFFFIYDVIRFFFIYFAYRLANDYTPVNLNLSFLKLLCIKLLLFCIYGSMLFVLLGIFTEDPDNLTFFDQLRFTSLYLFAISTSYILQTTKIFWVLEKDFESGSSRIPSDDEFVFTWF